MTRFQLGWGFSTASLASLSMVEESRTTGMGLWTDANEMLMGAKHLATVRRFELSQPLYYLLLIRHELTVTQVHAYLVKAHKRRLCGK